MFESHNPEAQSVSFHVIGHVESPFNEKFLIPRQPGIVPIRSKLVFNAPFHEPFAFEGLEGVSHLWLQFIFDGHKAPKTSNDLRVRPPRLGGNKKVGVFATRSSFRPNPLGLSLVKLLSIEYVASQAIAWVEGCDCLNGTKIIDIKPYLPYADSAVDAVNALASTEPEKQALTVQWSNIALQNIQSLDGEGYFSAIDFWASLSDFKAALTGLLALDPRPSYQAKKVDSRRDYGVYFSGLHIKFSCINQSLRVESCLIEDKDND